jgi:hypothetical protein
MQGQAEQATDQCGSAARAVLCARVYTEKQVMNEGVAFGWRPGINILLNGSIQD